ncbi:MAG: hypothetical protein ACKV2T_16120 [Kofleriaceae bacterium]
MRAFLLGLSLLSACDKWEHRLSKMDDLVDRLCACTEASCRRNELEKIEIAKRDWNDGDTIQGGGGSPALQGVTFVQIPAKHAQHYDRVTERIRSCSSKR